MPGLGWLRLPVPLTVTTSVSTLMGFTTDSPMNGVVHSSHLIDGESRRENAMDPISATIVIVALVALACWSPPPGLTSFPPAWLVPRNVPYWLPALSVLPVMLLVAFFWVALLGWMISIIWSNGLMRLLRSDQAYTTLSSQWCHSWNPQSSPALHSVDVPKEPDTTSNQSVNLSLLK